MLNYDSQFDIFDQYKEYKYGLFYIHGNSYSGQYWLTKRFAYILKATAAKEDECEIIKMEASKQQNSDTIERMENYIQADTGKLFEVVARKLVNTKMIFLIDENDPEYFIREFWCGFLEYLDNNQIYETKQLFVFLYDNYENKNCQSIHQCIEAKQLQVKNYTFPFIEIPIIPENISDKLFNDWWAIVGKAIPELKFPCTKDEMRKAILAKTTIVSEGTLRAICEKFEIRYNTIIEYVK